MDEDTIDRYRNRQCLDGNIAKKKKTYYVVKNETDNIYIYMYIYIYIYIFMPRDINTYIYIRYEQTFVSINEKEKKKNGCSTHL